MLDKKTFCHAIEEIKRVEDARDKLQSINSDFCFGTFQYDLQDELINVLAKSMNLQESELTGNTISWWIYDTKFGKDSPLVTIKENNKSKTYNLNTVEKLYYFCKQESKIGR